MSPHHSSHRLTGHGPVPLGHDLASFGEHSAAPFGGHAAATVAGRIAATGDGHGAATDAVLISQVRRGDVDAFDELATRHHGAVTLASMMLGGRPGLVEETFDAALATLRRLAGPSHSMRPFLLLLARHLDGCAPGQWEWSMRSAPVVPFRDLVGPAHRAVAAELLWLPEAWQGALWHRYVEGDDDATVGALLGVAPAMVDPLVQRALDGLRQGVISRARTRTLPMQCKAHALRLERSASTAVPRSAVRHAATCGRCGVLLADLAAVSDALPSLLAEHLLGPAAQDYLRARSGGAVRLV